MTTGVWVLGDQLYAGQAALAHRQTEQSSTPVLMIESRQHGQQRRYHAQKLVLVWSAMRHFAAELQQAGWPVSYEIAADFETPLRQWIQDQGITTLQVMEPSDRPFVQLLQTLDLPCDIKIIPNNHFLWSVADFQDWASSRKSLLMESFYREGRKRFDILMTGKDPVGGQWNFDKENRKPPKGQLNTPEPLTFAPDDITQAVIEAVQNANFATFGEIEPFRWAVTREHALQEIGRASCRERV